MATIYSDNLRIALQGTGDNNNTWGETLNDNALKMLEAGIAGYVAIDVAAGNVTLSTNNGSPDQARPMILKVTGAPGVTRVLTAPAQSKVYVIWNASDSAVQIKTSTGTAASIAADAIVWAFCDGTDFYTLGAPTNASGKAVFPGAADFDGDVLFKAEASFNEEYDNGNSGTAKTIDWGNGNKQKLTLTGNVTLTFTAPAGVGDFRLRLIQDATGERTVTPPTVKTPSGLGTSVSPDANAETIWSVYYNGADYYVASSLDWS